MERACEELRVWCVLLCQAYGAGLDEKISRRRAVLLVVQRAPRRHKGGDGGTGALGLDLC
jgi:hypothetical protein